MSTPIIFDSQLEVMSVDFHITKLVIQSRKFGSKLLRANIPRWHSVLCRFTADLILTSAISSRRLYIQVTLYPVCLFVWHSGGADTRIGLVLKHVEHTFPTGSMSIWMHFLTKRDLILDLFNILQFSILFL